MCPVIIAAVVLIFVYALIIFEIVHRTLAAMFGAFLTLAVLSNLRARPSFEEVLTWIDWETCGLLFGMMMMVGIFSTTGFFQFSAVRIYKMSKGHLWRLGETRQRSLFDLCVKFHSNREIALIFNCITGRIFAAIVNALVSSFSHCGTSPVAMLCVFTAVMSAFLDNVTTILLITPVTIQLCSVLDLEPLPIVVSLVLFSNVGGTATAIGNYTTLLLLSLSLSLSLDVGSF